MSIFTFHRFTTTQLQQAHQRLRSTCPLTVYSAPNNASGEDPYAEPEETPRRSTERREYRIKKQRHYNLKNH